MHAWPIAAVAYMLQSFQVSLGNPNSPKPTQFLREEIKMKFYTAMVASLALVGASAAMADSSSYPSPPSKHSAMESVDPDAIEGKDVLDSAGHQLGDVDEVVSDATNGQMAVIGLENSTKEVAIPVTKLSMSADGEKLSTTLSRAQLEALPDYDPMDKEGVED
jgi:hypothetical protein